MIRKLKKKFVLMNMGMITLVLLSAFVAVTISGWQEMERTADSALRRALSQRMGAGGPRTELGKGTGKGASAMAILPLVTVQTDEAGAILSYHQENLQVEQETLEEILSIVLASERETGNIRDYGLRYRKQSNAAGTKVAFVELQSQQSALIRQFLVHGIIGLVGLSVFLLLSILLANWALRPTERAWERQKQFAADASHELKTPLTVILANTDILLSHPDAPIREERKWLENTKAEGLRMKELVEDMLFLARADADLLPPMAALSLTDTVWNAFLPFEAVAFERGVQLQTDIADGISLMGNEKQLEQLTGILLDNAIHYAGPDGVVTLRLLQSGDGISLSVHNTGAAIDPKDLPHLFQRFYRAESSRDRKSGGYGLGLSIAERIACQHHGKITVKSSPEEGTAFTVAWKGNRHKQ